jgi:hypothetical protein
MWAVRDRWNLVRLPQKSTDDMDTGSGVSDLDRPTLGGASDRSGLGPAQNKKKKRK